MPAPHPQLVLERAGALATVTSNLHHMLMHLQSAAYYNRANALGIKLPSEQELIAAIGDCARLYQQEKTT